MLVEKMSTACPFGIYHALIETLYCTSAQSADARCVAMRMKCMKGKSFTPNLYYHFEKDGRFLREKGTKAE